MRYSFIIWRNIYNDSLIHCRIFEDDNFAMDNYHILKDGGYKPYMSTIASNMIVDYRHDLQQVYKSEFGTFRIVRL